jgi:TPP-dependent pyruvate/acetoin dehydrogenase alpha subunit
MTPAELIAFETEIAECFNAGQIRAPVHLYDGNEEVMIEIFKHVQPQDWVCCSWRSHYQCLLKGVPREQLKADILAGRSISLCYPEQRIVSSAIVGGIIPIGLGLAMVAKRAGREETVWIFVGDMTRETGIFHECFKYVCNWGLPVRFICEDNRKSVLTDTRAVWNSNGPLPLRLNDHTYEYEPRYPHAGAGKRVQF